VKRYLAEQRSSAAR